MNSPAVSGVDGMPGRMLGVKWGLEHAHGSYVTCSGTWWCLISHFITNLASKDPLVHENTLLQVQGVLGVASKECMASLWSLHFKWPP